MNHVIKENKGRIVDVDFGTSFSTILDVVVQKLDNYSKTTLIMYSNPDNEYPITLTISSTFEDDCETFDPTFECLNAAEFEGAIKKILASPDILKMIGVLYSKASMLTNG